MEEIILDSGPSTRPPSVKLPTIGDEIVVALTGVDVIPEMQFGSNPPVQAVNHDGNPKMQDVITGIVISCGGAEVGTLDSRRTPEPGEPVRIFAAGGTRREWYQAKIDFSGAMKVGMVIRHRYDGDEPSARPGNNDRKVRSFQFRDARPDESATTQKAIDYYHAEAAAQLSAPTVAAAIQSAPYPVAAAEEAW